MASQIRSLESAKRIIRNRINLSISRLEASLKNSLEKALEKEFHKIKSMQVCEMIFIYLGLPCISFGKKDGSVVR